MPCRVLVVDDDAEVRELMSELLASEGFDADFACDGLEALTRIQDGDRLPDVIVLDMMMPRMDGWAFRRHQNSDPLLADIPVVVVSSAPREQIERVNPAAVVPKPCDFDRLLSTIRVVARGRLAR